MGDFGDAAMDFGLMVIAIILGLIVGKFVKIGIAKTGMIPIAAGNALSQNPSAVLARSNGAYVPPAIGGQI